MSQERTWAQREERSQAQGELLKEVRRRDGACCRVCGLNVSFSVERESPLAMNYRILDPGTTLTVDGVVVACRMHLTEGVVPPAPSRPNWVENMAAAAAQVLEPQAAAPVVETEAVGEDAFGKLKEKLSVARAKITQLESKTRDTEPVLDLTYRLGRRDRDTVLGPDSGGQVRVQVVVYLPMNTDAFSFLTDYLGKFARDGKVPADVLRVKIFTHKNSPSVGTPNGALRDNSNPTEGELDPGAVVAPNAVAPAHNNQEGEVAS